MLSKNNFSACIRLIYRCMHIVRCVHVLLFIRCDSALWSRRRNTREHGAVYHTGKGEGEESMDVERGSFVFRLLKWHAKRTHHPFICVSICCCFLCYCSFLFSRCTRHWCSWEHIPHNNIEIFVSDSCVLWLCTHPCAQLSIAQLALAASPEWRNARKIYYCERDWNGWK